MHRAPRPLHHPLTDSHIAAIGRLDIVMVPIDGTYTMSLSGMADIVRRLRSSVVLPMHRFGTPLAQLLGQLRSQFAIDERMQNLIRNSGFHLTLLNCGWAADCCIAGPSRLFRDARARDRRLITVPTGMSRIPATSA